MVLNEVLARNKTEKEYYRSKEYDGTIYTSLESNRKSMRLWFVCDIYGDPIKRVPEGFLDENLLVRIV